MGSETWIGATECAALLRCACHPGSARPYHFLCLRLRASFETAHVCSLRVATCTCLINNADLEDLV